MNAPLPALHAVPGLDHSAIERAARDLLKALGAPKPGTRTVTSALHGLVRDDPRTRQEFLALTGRTSHA